MTPYDPAVDKDRRKGPDILVKTIRWFVLIGWIIMILALIFVYVAKPGMITFFTRHLATDLRTDWDMRLVHFILVLMILGFLISITGFYINLKRSRRKGDEIRVSFILLGMMSVLGIITYFLLFHIFPR